MLANRIATLALLAFLLLPVFSVCAQPSLSTPEPGWQGTRPQQQPIPVPPVQELRPTTIPQPSLPPSPQNGGEAHPQVMEMPAVQAPAPPAPQPPRLSLPAPPPPTSPSTDTQPKPAYLGIAGQTVQTCRYPAGVRITRVIEGSPAQQAGLKGEGTLTWQEAMAGVLTLTPLAPLVLPFVTDKAHGGTGDLILGVDGKRIHSREELEQEMQRFRPGDTIYFSILREQSGVQQISVQLTTAPDTSTTAMVR
jgi:PDZ domain-containing protein